MTYITKPFLTFISLAMLLNGCSLFQNKDIEYSKKLSLVFQAAVNLGDAHSLYSELDVDTKKMLPPPALQSFLAQVKRLCGRINYMGEITLSKNGGTFFPEFSSGKCLIKYTNNNEFKLTTFIIKPYKNKIPEINIDISSSFSNRVKEVSEHYFKHAKMIGLSIGIIENGELSYLYKGHQQFDKEEGVNSASIFEIGSLSKVFTGVLLADSIIGQKIQPSALVKTILPSLKNSSSGNIRVDSLSLHSSGLPRLPSDLVTGSSNPYGSYDRKKLLTFLKSQTIGHNSSVSKKVKYSNLGVALLGVSLEKMHEQSFEQLFQEKIAKPAHLSSATTEINQCSTKSLVHGHLNDTSVEHWTFKAFKSAGGVYASISDMTIFMKELFSETGLFNKHLAVMLNHQASLSEIDSTHLGIFTRALNKQKFYWHNGGTGGFSSFMAYDPDGKFGVVLLSNSFDSPLTELGMKLMTGL